jgi:hypothetical protein
MGISQQESGAAVKPTAWALGGHVGIGGRITELKPNYRY